ncbi:hypothetical protein [Thermococcus sp.]|nr:hypothetical protein [Thermococcus sp.]
MSKREAERILSCLRKKANLVGFSDYEEHFGIVAKRIKCKKKP